DQLRAAERLDGDDLRRAHLGDRRLVRVKTRAALFHGAGRPLEVRELDLREPRPHEVLVRVKAVGVCGTDLHVVKGEWDRPKPMGLGPEGAGTGEAGGGEADSGRRGDER